MFKSFLFAGLGVRLCALPGRLSEFSSGGQPVLQLHHPPDQISAEAVAARHKMLRNVS